MSAEKSILDINASILKHIAMLKPVLPKRAVFSVGDYSAQLLMSDLSSYEDTLMLFVERLKEDPTNQIKSSCKTIDVVGIDEKVDTHYWFNVRQYMKNDKVFVERLKSKPIDKLEGVTIIASTGEGTGSALLPYLMGYFKKGNVNSVAFAILPSQLQPPDAHFNALWSMAMCSSKGLTQILIERDALEGYVGVDRKGAVLKGIAVLNYLIELTLAKEVFVQEFSELSKSFNLKMFTVLSATGASLKVYGSIKNILDTTLLRPLARFDLSSASMLYVLVRMPRHLKDKLTRGKIELAIDEWFKEKTNLKAAYVSEPFYVDDGSDRLDILMFVGGFDLASMVASTDKKVKEIKNYAVKKKFVKEREWQRLISTLLK